MGNPQETTSVRGQESTVPPTLNEELSSITERFRQKHSIEIRVSGPILTAGYLSWQHVAFGYPGIKDYDEKFRGYLMVEPQDLPTALTLLDQIAQRRLDEDKSTDFKWLMMTCPPNTTDIKNHISSPSNIGQYTHLQPTDSRIVLYGNETAEIIEIYTALAADPRWERIEGNRRAAYEMQGAPSPIRGSNVFIDSLNREWRSLCF